MDDTNPSASADAPSDAEVDALLGQMGRIAVVVAGGLAMAFLGAGLGSWLEVGLG